MGLILKVLFYGKRKLPNRLKHEVCRYILDGCAGRCGYDYYLHFEIMDYRRNLFTGFFGVGKKRRVRRFWARVVEWPESGKPFFWKDEFYKLRPGCKVAG
jgi:hypothetical protein